MTHPAYQSAQWRRLREKVLERDGYVCQIHGPTCTVQATAVDHIVPLQSGGSWYDPANTRACCTNCNNWRAAKTRKRLRDQAQGYSNPRW